jgi:RHS repeat-associated protein
MRYYTETYTYDAVGNFQQLNHSFSGGGWTRLYDCDPTSNRLTSTSLPGDPASPPYSMKYTYDSTGNMTSMPHLASLTWDCKDRLQQVDLGGGGTAYYVYDVGGQRVRKVVERIGGDVEDRIYVGGYEVFRQTVAGTQAVERQSLHVMDGLRRVALVETKTRENGAPVALPVSLIRYQVTNLIDSACVEFDDTGALISYEEYFPFGGTSYHSVTGDIEVPMRRYRYVGKERDDETALYFYGARYYAPWLGRWTSPDPAGLVDGPGLYVYVRNNPVGLVDPTGAQTSQAPQTPDDKAAPPQPIHGHRRETGWGPILGYTPTQTRIENMAVRGKPATEGIIENKDIAKVATIDLWASSAIFGAVLMAEMGLGALLVQAKQAVGDAALKFMVTWPKVTATLTGVVAGEVGVENPVPYPQAATQVPQAATQVPQAATQVARVAAAAKAAATLQLNRVAGKVNELILELGLAKIGSPSVVQRAVRDVFGKVMSPRRLPDVVAVDKYGWGHPLDITLGSLTSWVKQRQVQRDLEHAGESLLRMVKEGETLIPIHNIKHVEGVAQFPFGPVYKQ